MGDVAVVVVVGGAFLCCDTRDINCKSSAGQPRKE